jgi:transcriptional regulator with XRE-family HTH domain
VVGVPRDPQALSPFGHQLRRWRHAAGVSQLALAAQAGTTPRHVSFLETGRSRPGRPLVLRLADALDVPLRERNALLAAAGFPPAFPEHDLGDAAMRSVALVLDRVLRAHEPYPAWVVGRGLRFRAANRAAEALFPGLCTLPPEAIVDLWYGPGPFRALVENWPEVVRAGVAALRREARRTPDPLLLALLRRAEAHARDAAASGTGAPPGDPELPVAFPRLRIGGRTVRTVSAVMRFDTAVEVTASELRVELMFPADEDSDAFFRQATGA